MNLLKNFTVAFLLIIFSLPINAQESSQDVVDKQELREIIKTTRTLLKKNYISESMGVEMGDYIQKRNKKGDYDGMTYKALAKELTNDLRSVSGDLHMSASYRTQKNSPEASMLDGFSDSFGSITNYGSKEVKILDNNIGYYKVSHFSYDKFSNEAKEAMANAVAFIKNTDALIIDVRNNPGGYEETVAFLVSYFVDTDVVDLQEYYCRYIERTDKISVQNDVPGKKLLDIPVYILTNKGTGSAGESFAYIMKHLKRATLIGETTVGAGNGSGYFQATDNFGIQIAVCETINAVTKTSWEKVGVKPNIEVPSEKAYDKALELAIPASKKYRTNKVDNFKSLITNMENALNVDNKVFSEEKIIESIRKSQTAELFNESDINTLGYKYLRENKPLQAEAIFKTNTLLYPESPNAYDSYGEALFANKKVELSIINYDKAIALAKQQDNPNLDIFIQNKETTTGKRKSKD